MQGQALFASASDSFRLRSSSKRSYSSSSSSETNHDSQLEEPWAKRRRIIAATSIKQKTTVGLENLTINPAGHTAINQVDPHVVYIDSLDVDSDDDEALSAHAIESNLNADTTGPSIAFPADLAKRLKLLEEERMMESTLRLRLEPEPPLSLSPSDGDRGPEMGLVLYRPLVLPWQKEQVNNNSNGMEDAYETPATEAPPSSPQALQEDHEIGLDVETPQDNGEMDVDY